MYKSRKSQAALEFLMTYGWAILVVLIVISALAYFGVLNPQRLLPARCTLPTGIACKNFVVKSGTPGTMTIKLLNGMGSGILIQRVTSNYSAGNPIAANCINTTVETFGTQTGVAHLNNGEERDFTLSCPSIAAAFAGTDQKYKWDLIIYYYPDDSTVTYSKKFEGEMLTGVES